MKYHPLILAHSQTYDRKFPLILVVGREPNNSSVSNGEIGLYDFVKHSRCAFWNVAFSIFGKINGLQCKETKNEFLRRKASPILFTDAIPQGIENTVSKKHDLRNAHLKSTTEHVDAIFKHNDVINRVSLVLLTGLNDPMYYEFKKEIEKRLLEFEIPVKEVPFFYPTNTPKILDCLTVGDRQLFQRVYKNYTEEIDNLPELPADLLGNYCIDAPESEYGILFNSQFSNPL